MRFLLRYYIVFIAFFLLTRLFFVLGNTPENLSLSFFDFVEIEVYGLLLDSVIAGYLIILPLLLTFAAVWWRGGLRLRKLLMPYSAAVALLIAVMCVADSALYPFWQFKLDASVFLYLDSPQNAVASVSAGFVALRVFLCLLLGAALTFALYLATPKKLEYSNRRKLRTATLFLLCIPLAISIRGGLGESTANIGRVYFSETEFCNHAAVNPVFSMLYSLGKTGDYSAQFDFFPEEEREKLFDGLFSTESVGTQKILNQERPNILLILLEGFGGALSRNEEIAPNFCRLAEEGVLFDNCYSSSFRTDRGVLATLSGYPAFPNLSVMKMPVKSRTLPCLANSLNKEGYESAFLYGGDINFTNMQSYLRTGGYSLIVSDKNFSFSESNKSKWGVDDEKTFLRLQDMIHDKRVANKRAASKGKPWHIGFLTLSSHEPWEVPYSRLENEQANAFAYTDHCLGEFIKWFKGQEEWENTLVVLIPDHGYQYPKTISHEEHHRNQMLWLGGAVKKPLKVEKIMSQTDMAATLLAQIGVKHDDYLFSRDVFSGNYDRRAFAYFTFGGGMGFVEKDGYLVYDLNGDKILENSDESGGAQKENEPNEKPLSEKRLNKAKAIIQTLYDDLGSR